jgi:peptide/nickel transport system substrate-binding protein
MQISARNGRRDGVEMGVGRDALDWLQRTLLATVLLLVLTLVALAGPNSAEAEPSRDRLVLGLPLEPPNLDPTSGAAAAVDEVVYGNVFEGLTRLTQNGAVAPALAESWEAAPDGLSWTFHLRRGVAFSDGSPFDASVAKFSLDRIAAEGSTNAQKALFAPIQNVEVVDPANLRIRLSRPMATLPYVLAWGDAVMVSPRSAATNAVNPVGTGPFRFDSWQRGSQLTLTRRPDYWGPAPRLNTVVFRFISDPTAAFAAVSAGDVDAFPN